MTDSLEAGIGILTTITSVDMKTVQKNDLYTAPAGKSAYVTSVVVRDTSDSLAGGTDYDFGTGANADTWRLTVDLSSMTTAGTDYMEIRGADVTKYTKVSAGEIFGIKPITGSTASATATVVVLGFLA